MINKYRVHEVAKDFDCPSKEILDIVTKHFEGQKKSMTALEEAELDVIFEIVTQENSVERSRKQSPMHPPRTRKSLRQRATISRRKNRRIPTQLRRAEQRANSERSTQGQAMLILINTTRSTRISLLSIRTEEATERSTSRSSSRSLSSADRA